MLFKFYDDEDLKKTGELTLILNSLRHFCDGLTRTIVAWNGFEQTGLRFLQAEGADSFRENWQGLIDGIQGRVAALKSLQTVLSQNLAFFNSMREGVRKVAVTPK